ncbi:MAG: hypothetical protein ACI8UO_005221 [Verrucomicrobiales bacterium]|jgi:hypothetical protein
MTMETPTTNPMNESEPPSATTHGTHLIERLLGVLIAEQTQTLSFVNAQLAEVREARIEPYRELLIRVRDVHRKQLEDLEGNRTLAPDYDEDLPAEASDVLEENMGEGADLTTEILEDVQHTKDEAPSRSSQLADLYVDLAQLFIHYNMLHSLGIGMRDEPLAGMVWGHMREVHRLQMEVSLLMPRLVIRQPDCNPVGAMTIDELRNRAVEQTARACSEGS